MNSTADEIVLERVEVALNNKFRLELAHPQTKQPLTTDERRDILFRGFLEIAKGMGVDRFAETPVERLDQFLVMSIIKNQDTAGLIRSLVNSFMIAYGRPETADRAFDLLVKIEGLRAEIALIANQPSENQALLNAAMELETWLKQHTHADAVTGPSFQIMYGADRLYVRTERPISGLPSKIGNVPVEHQIGLLRASTH